MKTIKNSQLFVISLSLALAIVLFTPVAFAKEQSNSQLANLEDQEDNNSDSQGNENDIKVDDLDDQGDENSVASGNEINGEEHRSTVSTFVQSLLNVADREQGGIGDQVRAIATEQNDSKDNVANAIDKIKNRNELKTFFIGTDYKNVGQLRKEMVKTQNQIDKLNILLSQTTNADDQVTLLAQIQVLEQQQQKINDFLKINENKFSLFGWFVRLFNK